MPEGDDTGHSQHTSGASAAIGDVTGEMPEPQEHAIQAEESDRESRAESVQGATDRDGNTFDPEIHRTDSTGNPILSSNGKLQKRPGRKKGSPGNEQIRANKSRLHTPGQSSGPNQSAESALPGKGDPRAAGQMIAEQIFTLGQLFGGEEWAPFEVSNPEFAKQYGINERQMHYEAWANYCEAKGVQDIPPGIMVCCVMSQYVAMRINMPKTKTRFQRLKDWVAYKYSEMKHKRGSKNGTRTNSGHDTERENERGEVSSA